MDIELYYGPPGTGKTTTLLDILDFEINKKKVDPKEIAFVSFTRKGAQQGALRAKEKFDFPAASFKYFRTLHSLAFMETNASRGIMMNRKKYFEFSKKMGMNFIGYYSEELHHNDDRYLFASELYRNNTSAGKHLIEALPFDTYNFVSKNYKRYKDTFGYADFTDLVEHFIAENRSIPVKVAIIDEAQDLTTLQWKMVWLAFRHCERVYIAGDDDQAIYEWSGADVEYFLGLHGNQHVLRQSYRLPKNMVDYAKRISTRINRRIDKAYSGKDEQGEIVAVNDLSNFVINPEETYLFLSRNNTHLKMAEELVQKHGLHYAVKGVPFVRETDIDAIGFYEHKRRSSHMSTSEEKMLQSYLKSNVTDFSKPWYDTFDWPLDKINYLRTLIARKRLYTMEPLINISTIHSIKGGEADHVVLLSDITKNVNDNLERNPDSEHRVFYVGATRCKKSLTIVLPQSKYSYPLL